MSNSVLVGDEYLGPVGVLLFREVAFVAITQPRLEAGFRAPVIALRGRTGARFRDNRLQLFAVIKPAALQ